MTAHAGRGPWAAPPPRGVFTHLDRLIRGGGTTSQFGRDLLIAEIRAFEHLCDVPAGERLPRQPREET